MNVLVTGGAGYIGSHAVQLLLKRGHNVLAVDNLFRGHTKALDLLRPLAPDRLTFVKADIGDASVMTALMHAHRTDAVLHFGALAYVGESVDHPLDYFHNNVEGTVSVLRACESANVQRLVFSSSCSTYGQPPENMIPVPETCPQSPMSPYGRTKWWCEHVINDFAESRARANKPFAFALLRYFNVCGSDRSGLLGEDHTPESHIIPVVIQAALGLRPEVSLFGTDYPTPDGTCVRDYIHVEDLVDAHAKVMDALKPGDRRAYNLGIGKGYSVREIIRAVREVSGKTFKVVEHPRRAGDPPRLFADASKIQRELGWKAQVTDLHEIIRSAYRWFEKHPKGYQS